MKVRPVQNGAPDNVGDHTTHKEMMNSFFRRVAEHTFLVVR
jgi:hypothetical protein